MSLKEYDQVSHCTAEKEHLGFHIANSFILYFGVYIIRYKAQILIMSISVTRDTELSLLRFNDNNY